MPAVITPAAVLLALNDWRTRRRRGSLARRLAVQLERRDGVAIVAPAHAPRDED